MLKRTVSRSSHFINKNALTLQLKHVTNRNISPQLFHQLNKLTSRTSYVTKSVATVTALELYSTSGAIPLEWLYGMLGGSFIGGSSAMYLLFHGRIAGISGIFGRILDHTLALGRNPNKLASCSQFGFLTGLITGGMYWNNVANRNNGLDLYGNLPEKIQPFQQVNYSPYILALSGLLVGIGTRIGSGCTSGHGVCGLARQSVRSLTAVGTFMGTAAVTTTVMEKYSGDLYNLKGDNVFKVPELSQLTKYGVPLMTGMLLCGGIYSGMRGIGNEHIISLMPSIICGFGFSTGLIYSGMTKPDKIRGFLNLNNIEFKKHFDPTMAFVFVGALGMTVPLFPIIIKYMKTPLFAKMWYYPIHTGIDKRLIIGSSIFGVGWGVGGVCPGPGIVCLSSDEFSSPLWLWFVGLMFGMRVAVLL